MIMNRLLGVSSVPFSSVSVVALGTAFVPKSLHVVNGVWLIGGNTSASSSHPVLAQSDNGQTFTITEFTNRSFDLRGVGFTNNGYVLFAANGAYPLFAINKPIGSLVSGTDSTGMTRYSAGTYGTDIVVNGNQVYVTGYYNAANPCLNVYSTAPPSFNTTWSDGLPSPPICVTLAGARPVWVSAYGHIGEKNSVGAQWLNGYSQVAEDLTGISTQRIAYVNGTVVVGGKKADGTYIWYSTDAPSSSMRWTEQKISNTSCEVKGVCAVGKKTVVMYVTQNGDISFWVSKPNNIAATLATDYWDERLNPIATDTTIDMKDYNGTAMLVSHTGNTVYVSMIE